MPTMPMLLQAATAAAPVLPAAPAATTVAISTSVLPPCDVSPDPAVITVCGRKRDDRYRLKPIPLPAGMKPPIDRTGVDFDLGPAHGNLYVAQVARPDGLPDKRIMVTLTMPF